MKRNLLKVIICAFCFGLLIVDGNAINPNIEVLIESRNSDEWIEIKNENGIKISFKRTFSNEQKFLKVKFENITNKSVQFNWTLINRNNKTLFNNDSVIVLPNGKSASKLVQINNGDISGFDCSVNINIQ